MIARVCGLTEEQNAAMSTGQTAAAATPRPTAQLVGDVDDDIVELKSKISYKYLFDLLCVICSPVIIIMKY